MCLSEVDKDCIRMINLDGQEYQTDIEVHCMYIEPCDRGFIMMHHLDIVHRTPAECRAPSSNTL